MGDTYMYTRNEIVHRRASYAFFLVVLCLASVCIAQDDYNSLVTGYLAENWGPEFSLLRVEEFYRVYIPYMDGEYIYLGIYIRKGDRILKCLGCIWVKDGVSKLNAVYQVGEEAVS
jgi:hypothetical protein